MDKKRTHETDDFDTRSNKRVKNEDDSPADMHTMLLDLSLMISTFSRNKYVKIPEQEGILHELSIVVEAIPQLAIFGDQSSGKSSVLKQITGFDLNTSAEMGTRCPIIINLSKQHEKEEYLIKSISSNNEYVYNSLKEAENMLIENFNDSLAMEYYVQCHIPNSADLNIVDLPGYNNDSNSDYFQAIKDQFLDKEESIILHVVKADTDPKNVHSTNYLDNVKGKIIKVVTHLDSFEVSSDKKTYIETYRKQSEDGILCLTIPTRVDSEVEMIGNYSIAQENDKIGIDSIKEFVREKIQQRTEERFPDICKLLIAVHEKINQALDKIHRTSPDMRDERWNFQQSNNNMLRDACGDGGWITVVKKSINDIIESADYESLSETVPDVESVRSMIENGSSVNLRGTEGYGHVINRVLKKLLTEIEPIISNTIDDCIRQFVREYYLNQIESTPYSEKALAHISEYVLNQLQTLAEEVKTEIRQHIQERKTAAFCNYEDVYQQQIHQNTSRIVYEFVNRLKKRRNIAESAKAQDTVEAIIEDIVRQELTNDPYRYREKAVTARSFSIELWRSDCRTIKNNIIHKFDDKIKTFTDNIEREVWQIDQNLFMENSEVDRYRQELLKIEHVICQILAESPKN